MTRYFGRYSDIRIECSTEPHVRPDVGLFIVPADLIPDLGKQEVKLLARVLGYGPAGALRSAYLDGADDYLKDPWKPEELALRAARLLPPGPAIFPWGHIDVDAVEATLGVDDSPVPLTIRLSHPESIILRALANRPGEPVPRTGLYYLLWGNAGVGSRAVDVHIGHLRRKLGDVFDGRASAPRIETVHGVGYLLR